MTETLRPTKQHDDTLRGGIYLRRRTLLQRAALVAAVGAVGAVLNACGSTSDTTVPATTGAMTAAPATSTTAPAPTTTSATGAMPTTAPKMAATSGSPATAGTLTIPLISNPTPWPVVLAGGLSSILLNKALFGQLVRPDAKTLAPVPDLAEKWEISPDGMQYTFSLRKGVKWHNGDPLTVDDVKFTFDSMLDPKINASFRTNMGPLTSVEIVDPTTVKLNLKQPYAPFLTMLAYNVMIVPKKLLDGQDLNKPTAFVQNPVGTGPYKWKEYVSGDHVTLIANPDFWDGAPKISTLVYKVLPDINTQVAQLRTGEVDVVMIEPSQVDALQSVPNVVINAANQTNYNYLSLNNSNPLFSDVRVRQALSYALDRDTILKTVMRGKGSVATGPISPPMGWAYPSGQTPFAYDVKKAQDLLAQAGWQLQSGKLMKDGQPFKFKLLLDVGNPTRKDFALVAQQSYQKLGMDVAIDAEEFNKWYELTGNSTYDMVVSWWITPGDPDAITAGYSTNNSDKYQNPDVDALFAQGRAATSQEARKKVYDQLQQKLYNEQVDVFMLYPQEFRAFSKRLQGYTDIGIRDALYYTYTWTLGQ